MNTLVLMRKLSILGLIFFVTSSHAQVRPVRKQSSQKKQLIARPFTVEKIVSRLQDVAKKEYTEAALIKRILKDGVDFKATPQNLARLSGGGASQALLEAVQRLSPAPAEPVVVIVKPEPTGSIDVTCAPAECSVRFGREAAVTSVDGRLPRKKLPHGSVAIEITKEGFIPFRSNVAVQNETAFVRAVLLPDEARQRSLGIQLKNKIVEAMGGQAEMDHIRSFLAIGSATIWGGVKSTCSVEAFLRTPDKAFFRTRSGKRSMYEVDLLPTVRVKSSLSESEARSLEVGLRLYARYHVTEILRRLNGPGVQLRSESSEPREGAELHAQTSTEKIAIFLDSNGRPKEVREDVPLGEGVRAIFSTYTRYGNLYLPAKVTVVYAGSPKQGIEIEFNSIALNPSLKEADYRVKKPSK